ncbi:MarR family transcriptional regulator [Rhodococcus sp. X156]|uniref:MarR family winged helix-turn-helix transcriptional regulator n=1 Tax=Rhodococcus sp. X156 TaxID=2499145 RepID=UPI0013E2A3C8|nr:MarR family transcriptional regulator [Rhodococcus sp. X156]
MAQPSRVDGPELERITIGLVNAVAYSSSSRFHARLFSSATNLVLPSADIRFLEHLRGRGQVATSSIATAIGIDISQASRQASRLEALGHVVRTADPADRRRTLVALSAETSAVLDRWLLTWAADYARPVADWPEADRTDLAAWFTLVHRCLARSLPQVASSNAAEHWRSLISTDAYPPATRELLAATIGLVSWVAQSGGYSELLATLDAPITQHDYLTMRLISRFGPLSLIDVAERMAIDPSQASRRARRLTELGLVTRAVNARDRRSNLVQVSAAGADLERRVRSRQLSLFRWVLEPVSDTQRTRLTPLTSRYVTRLLTETPALPEAALDGAAV